MPMMNSDILLKKGDVIEASAPIAGANNQFKTQYSFTTKAGIPATQLLIIGSHVTEVKDATQSDTGTSSSVSLGGILKAGRKIQIATTLGLWAIWGLIAWKFWGKNNIWKGMIVLTGAGNAYNTYKILGKPLVQTKGQSNETTIKSKGVSDGTTVKSKSVDEIYAIMTKFAETSGGQKMPKEQFTAKYNSWNEKEKQAAGELVEGLVKINTTDLNKMFEEAGKLQMTLSQKYGDAVLQKIAQ